LKRRAIRTSAVAAAVLAAAALAADAVPRLTWEQPTSCPDLPAGENLQCAFVTADGAVLVTARSAKDRDSDLYLSSRHIGQWEQPMPLEVINAHPWKDTAPTTALDARVLIFSSDRPGGRGGFDLWMSRLEGGHWGAARNLGPEVNTPADELSAALSPNGQLLVYARRDGTSGMFTLCSAHRDSPFGWRTGHPIRALAGEFESLWPAFSPDGRFLYFSSDRPGGAGTMDLWRSALDHGSFRAPENMGPKINTAGEETCPSLSAQGYVLTFLSAVPAESPPSIFRARSRETLLVVESDLKVIAGRILSDIPLEWYVFASLLITSLAMYVVLARLNRENLLRRCLVVAFVAHLVVWRLSAMLVLRTPGDDLKQPGPPSITLRGLALRAAADEWPEQEQKDEPAPWQKPTPLAIPNRPAAILETKPVDRPIPGPAAPAISPDTVPPHVQERPKLVTLTRPIPVIDFHEQTQSSDALPEGPSAVADRDPHAPADTPREDQPVDDRLSIPDAPAVPVSSLTDPMRHTAVPPAPVPDAAAPSPGGVQPHARFQPPSPQEAIPRMAALTSIPGMEKKTFVPGGSAASGRLSPSAAATDARGTDGEAFLLREERYRGRAAAAAGGGKETEKAVEMALAWLAVRQEADGRWSSRHNGGGEDHDIGVTGLATLAFLGAGYTDTGGPYTKQVTASLGWLMKSQQEGGQFGSGTAFFHGYYHAIATLALAEAYGMTRKQEYGSAAQKAVDYAVDAHQAPGSGWRYKARQAPDTSVTGWFVMALRSASLAGLRVKEESLRGADKWLDRTFHKDGWYHYQNASPGNYRLTAVGAYSRLLLGHKPEERCVSASADILLKNPPNAGKGRDYYYWYCGTLLMFQMGSRSDYWTVWNNGLRATLLSQQQTTGKHAGTWDFNNSAYGNRAGRVYSTAMSTMCLEIYYRYLPLYK